jgi:hypothetical protein
MPVPSRHASPLSEELGELIASGVDVYVATRDAALEPESMLAMGVRLHAGSCSLTVFLPEVVSAPTLRNLESNGQVAITISRPRDERTVQLKGRTTRIRPADAVDKEHLLVARAAMVEQFAGVGIPRSATRRIVWWPSVAVEVEVRDVFEQTPGPHAGFPLQR